MQSLLLGSQTPILNIAVDLTYCAWHNSALLGLSYCNLKKKKNKFLRNVAAIETENSLLSY